MTCHCAEVMTDMLGDGSLADARLIGHLHANSIHVREHDSADKSFSWWIDSAATRQQFQMILASFQEESPLRNVAGLFLAARTINLN